MKHPSTDVNAWDAEVMAGHQPEPGYWEVLDFPRPTAHQIDRHEVRHGKIDRVSSFPQKPPDDADDQARQDYLRDRDWDGASYLRSLTPRPQPVLSRAAKRRMGKGTKHRSSPEKAAG